jgi:hypothetical protein
MFLLVNNGDGCLYYAMIFFFTSSTLRNVQSNNNEAGDITECENRKIIKDGAR